MAGFWLSVIDENRYGQQIITDRRFAAGEECPPGLWKLAEAGFALEDFSTFLAHGRRGSRNVGKQVRDWSRLYGFAKHNARLVIAQTSNLGRVLCPSMGGEKEALGQLSARRW